MTATTAAASGTFMLGGDIKVNRLGFGAMRITGPGIWGEPEDRPEAIRVLERVRELEINFIDTADAYGPDVSEDLIREVLHPYGEIIVATKGANTRQGPDKWHAVGRPEYLRQAVLMSLRRLGLERIDLWQLHRIDPACGAKRSEHRRNSGGREVFQSCQCAEFIQSGLPAHRGCIGLLRKEQYRLHSLVPVGGR